MYSKLSTLERLSFSEEAIAIAQSDPVLKDVFEEEGFTEARFQIGLAKQQVALGLQIDQQIEYSSRLEATGKLDALFENVRSSFINDRNIAKIALQRAPGLFERLRLIGPAASKREFLLQQVRHFYQEILADENVAGILAGYSLSAEVLQGRQQDVEALVLAMQNQQRQRAEAQLATRRRRAAMADLDDWMYRFLFVAKRLLKNDPKQLEKLGIPVK